MGLREARQGLIAALREGRFEHEARATIAEKNLLAIGEIDVDDVVRMLQRTRGDQYEEVAHHWEASVTVHVFAPEIERERWYVKAYFLGPPPRRAVFISVHR